MTIPAASRFVVFGMIASCCLFGFAQGKPNPRNDEQRENQRVKEAQKDLNEAQEQHKQATQELAEASQRLTKAEKDKRLAIDNSQQVRKQVEALHEQRIGLPELLKKQADAQTEYDRAAAPVLEALKLTAPYVAAVADAKAAHEALQLARKSTGTNASGNDLSALVRRTLKPAELEKETLGAHASVQSARQPLTRAQEKVRAAREQAKAATEKDATLKAALKELDQQVAAVDKAKATLARDREKLAAAATKVSHERQQLARAQAADRKDDNQPKKNNNKPNNNKPNNKKPNNKK